MKQTEVLVANLKYAARIAAIALVATVVIVYLFHGYDQLIIWRKTVVAMPLFLGLVFGFFGGSGRGKIRALNDELNYRISYDALTKVRSRAHFFECAVPQMVQPGQVMLLDVDHFKLVNDTYGHAVGDDVLVFIGKILNSVIDGHGVVARFGGEEFVILLEGANKVVAHELAADISSAFASNVAEARGHKINVTLSGGIAAIDNGGHIDTALQAADTALYEAKSAGRNRIYDANQTNLIGFAARV